MKMFRVAAAGLLSLLAAACLISPGKFDASLDIRRDGTFTYRYAGEVVFTTPASAAEAEAAERDDAFDAKTQICWGEGTDPLMSDKAPVSRACTKEELEERRKSWEQDLVTTAENRKQEAARMKAIFGDPSDPEKAAEFSRRLLSQDGWKRVTHKGAGVFDVLYEKTGRLDYDYVFPIFPQVDWIIPFVHVAKRTDGRVRVVAPGFVQPEGLAEALGMGAMGSHGQGANGFSLPKPRGTFTLTTDAEVLTNNTDDGAAGGPGGTKVLKWTVGPIDAKKPEALLKL